LTSQYNRQFRLYGYDLLLGSDEPNAGSPQSHTMKLNIDLDTNGSAWLKSNLTHIISKLDANATSKLARETS